MDALPHELVSEISLYLSDEDALSLRLVQPRLRNILTRRVFRRLVAHDSYASVRRLQQMLEECQDAMILNSVETVVFDGAKTDHFEIGADSPLPSIKAAFSKLHRLPNLVALELHFIPENLDGGYYAILQDTLATALKAQTFPNLRSLEWWALSAWLSRIRGEDDALLNIFRPLSRLCLVVKSVHYRFRWATTSANLRTIFRFGGANLTTLQLASDSWQGALSPLTFHDYLFPALTDLSLGKIVFPAMNSDDASEDDDVDAAEDLDAEEGHERLLPDAPPNSGVDRFIMKHRTQLQRLELRNCAVFVPDGEWQTYFRSWARSLTSLTEFVWKNTRKPDEILLYAWLKGKEIVPYRPLEEGFQLAEIEALEHLVASAVQRR